MMRNIYPTAAGTRPGYPYPSHNNMSAAMRGYPQMNSGYAPVSQFSAGMGGMGSMSAASNMSSMPRQMQQISMATDYNVNLVSISKQFCNDNYY